MMVPHRAVSDWLESFLNVMSQPATRGQHHHEQTCPSSYLSMAGWTNHGQKHCEVFFFQNFNEDPQRPSGLKQGACTMGLNPQYKMNPQCIQKT